MREESRSFFRWLSPLESDDWQKANYKLLTEQEAEELVKLAEEARRVRKETDQL